MSGHKKADFIGLGRTFGVAFSLETRGILEWDILLLAMVVRNDFYEYDPALNTWVQKADFPGTGRQRCYWFSIGAKGYIEWGVNQIPNNLMKDFYEWDQATNIWTQNRFYREHQGLDKLVFRLKFGVCGFGK